MISTKPSTLLVIFSNIFIFMLMQILLFWYVISKEIENILINKTDIASKLIKNSTYLHDIFVDFIKSDKYTNIYNKSLIDKEIRNDYNIDLTWKWMIGPFIIVIFGLLIGIIYTSYVHRCSNNNTLKLDKADLIILTMVFLSFLTEIIVIFVLIMRYVYISDMEIILFLYHSEFIKFKDIKDFLNIDNIHG